jgi:hypothetical protein
LNLLVEAKFVSMSKWKGLKFPPHLRTTHKVLINPQ